MNVLSNPNDIAAVVEADRAHIWHHLSQHKQYETTDPRVIVEAMLALVTASLVVIGGCYIALRAALQY